MSKNVSILIEGVSVNDERTDDVLAISQVVGSALKNNGVLVVENVNVRVESEVA